jgi:hypothetical protein
MLFGHILRRFRRHDVPFGSVQVLLMLLGECDRIKLTRRSEHDPLQRFSFLQCLARHEHRRIDRLETAVEERDRLRRDDRSRLNWIVG